MSALDELLAKWRENPDSGTTLALCTYLGTSLREDLIREVGSTAEAWHKDDASVMLAVGTLLEQRRCSPARCRWGPSSRIRGCGTTARRSTWRCRRALGCEPSPT